MRAHCCGAHKNQGPQGACKPNAQKTIEIVSRQLELKRVNQHVGPRPVESRIGARTRKQILERLVRARHKLCGGFVMGMLFVERGGHAVDRVTFVLLGLLFSFTRRCPEPYAKNVIA